MDTGSDMQTAQTQGAAGGETVSVAPLLLPPLPVPIIATGTEVLAEAEALGLLGSSLE